MAKKGFLDGYKTYNPHEGGYGDASEWRAAFQERMGFEQATKVVGDNDPHAILGVGNNASWNEIKTAYRKLAMRYHPDRNLGDDQAVEKFKQVQAAYEVLEHRRK